MQCKVFIEQTRRLLARYAPLSLPTQRIAKCNSRERSKNKHYAYQQAYCNHHRELLKAILVSARRTDMTLTSKVRALVLESLVSFFTSSYFNNIFNIVNKDFTVTDVSCIKNFLCSCNYQVYWNF